MWTELWKHRGKCCLRSTMRNSLTRVEAPREVKGELGKGTGASRRTLDVRLPVWIPWP